MKVKDINELAAHLQYLGLANADVMGNLSTLKEGEAFSGRATARNDEGRLSCRYQIWRDASSEPYRIDSYNAVLLSVPDIAHNVFDGIDSRDLEARLIEADIYNRWYDVFDRHSAIAKICVDLSLLAKSVDPDAVAVANLLTLKYVTWTPLQDWFDVNVNSKPYEREVFIPIRGKENDIGIDQACNLLAGRGIMKTKEALDSGPPEAYWLVAEEGRLKILPEFDIVGQLVQLPFLRLQERDVVQYLFIQLISGDKVAIDMFLNGQRRSGYIIADPHQGKLALTDQSGQRIILPEFKQRQNNQDNNKERKSGNNINGSNRPGKRKGPSM